MNTPCAVLLHLVLAAGLAVKAGDRAEAARLRPLTRKLRPLHRRISKPAPGDWLDQHRETGQTFRQYVAARPVTLAGKRRVIYIQPLGDFTASQRRIVSLTSDFMSRFYNVSVIVKDTLPLEVIPDKARRRHPSWGMPQVLSSYVLDDVLKPRFPKDAVAFLAFTASDLWPGKGWNFVFGQASLRERVGVWSIYRNGDPDESDAAFRLCLRRTLKTAVHETGHMFTMKHCTLYECGMCGSNHREESDRRPLWFCPECVAKVWWATGADPVKRYEQLAEFCDENGLDTEAVFCRRSAQTLTKKESP